jgi:hypothetical protein
MMAIEYSQGMHSNELDHIVLACRDLESGSAWLEQQLGVSPSGGGQHLGWGTHNRLLSLNAPDFPGVYLELIALDPGQSLPDPPRQAPFGLMNPAVQAHVALRPRLIHSVHRVSPGHLADAVRAAPYAVSPPQAMSRGARHWQIALASWPQEQPSQPHPTLIDWGDTASAGFSLGASGLSLISLDQSRLQARIATARGERLLD